MKPVTRREIFENAVAEGKDPGIKPLTREEAILAKHAKREASGGSGGVTSWNDIPDRPFGERIFTLNYVASGYTPNTELYPLVSSEPFGGEGTVEKYRILEGDITQEEWDMCKVITDEHGIEYTCTTSGTAVKGFKNEDFETISLELVDGSICIRAAYGYTCNKSFTASFGTVKTIDPKYLPKAAAVADVTEAPTAEQFNALLASLREAGYLAT